MELRVLGPLRMCVDGVALPLGTRKQQTVLAVLATHPGSLISTDMLVDELWPDAPPASAVPNLRGYAGKLRRLFQASRDGGIEVSRQSGGYLLAVGAATLDLTDFEMDLADGTRALAESNLSGAVSCFERALGRWTGGLLAGVPRGPMLERRCADIEEQRLAATERLGEAYLAADRPDQTISLLREHVRMHPLRERGQAVLMRALERIGDVSGALVVYANARDILVRELGIEPGAGLRQVQREVLDRGAAPAAVKSQSPPAGHRYTPRELPPTLGHFVGRASETASLLATVTARRQPDRGRPTVVVCWGPGGIGKSSFAVYLGHIIKTRYPDGHLYLDLLGSTPAVRPLSPFEALRRVLIGLGIKAADVPKEEPAAIGLFRSLTSDRRLLILFDNASDAEQMRNLLPASSNSMVIVTTRYPLSTLDADSRVRLDGLNIGEGVRLLKLLLPDGPLDDDLAKRIVSLCDNLPLAIRIAAGRLSGRPDLSAEDLASHLSIERNRLDELQVDGLAVRSCIGVSYSALISSPSVHTRLAAQAFRRLGLIGIPNFGVDVVAALLAEPSQARIRKILGYLVEAGLVEPIANERYRLHDLVRLLAIEHAEKDRGEDTEKALRRVLSYYTEGVQQAAYRLRPARVTAVVSRPQVCAGVAPPVFTDVDSAVGWIEKEAVCLVALTEQVLSIDSRLRAHALFIADPLWEILHRRHDWDATMRIAELAVAAGNQTGDIAFLAWGRMIMGCVAAELGDSKRSLIELRCASVAYTEMGNQLGIAVATNALGVSAHFRGDFDDAFSRMSECLELLKELNDHKFRALVLNNLGAVYGARGNWDEALAAFAESLAIRREYDLRVGLEVAMVNYASALCVLGDTTAALKVLSNVIDIAREAISVVFEHDGLLIRSEVYLRAGRYREAYEDAQAACALGRKRHDPYTEGLALWQMGKVLAVTGDIACAERVVADSERTITGMARRRDPFLEAVLFNFGVDSKSGSRNLAVASTVLPNGYTDAIRSLRIPHRENRGCRCSRG